MLGPVLGQALCWNMLERYMSLLKLHYLQPMTFSVILEPPLIVEVQRLIWVAGAATGKTAESWHSTLVCAVRGVWSCQPIDTCFRAPLVISTWEPFAPHPQPTTHEAPPATHHPPPTTRHPPPPTRTRCHQTWRRLAGKCNFLTGTTSLNVQPLACCTRESTVTNIA